MVITEHHVANQCRCNEHRMSVHSMVRVFLIANENVLISSLCKRFFY